MNLEKNIKLVQIQNEVIQGSQEITDLKEITVVFVPRQTFFKKD